MSLRSSIVCVNEFTHASPSGGTRGGTPGRYVLRYLAREGAYERLTPYKRFESDAFLLRYMAREGASEAYSKTGRREDFEAMKEAFRDQKGLGGLAFGPGDVSLSDEALRAKSRQLQKAFDEGKTVMKTVVSFETPYLLAQGVLPPGFEFHELGDFKDSVDQLKLRMAMMEGLSKLSKYYDDLDYVGVIQIDTEHVHCHLAMADLGTGTVMPDGTQRGKISQRAFQDFRRGVDQFLDDKQTVRHLASSAALERRNTLGHVKAFTTRAIEKGGVPQFLVACLPEDRRLWRAGTHREEMKKANEVMRDFVLETLRQEGSGYKEALRSVDAYANYRQEREGLTTKEARRLIDQGRKRILDEAMNGVYGILKGIPKSEFQVSTRMMDLMAMPYESLYDQRDPGVEDPLIEFSFKLRSYSSRLDHHKKERKKYEALAQRYEEGVTAPDSQALYAFFQLEAMYQTMLMVKYQYFLDFVPPRLEYSQDLADILAQQARVQAYLDLMEDPGFLKAHAKKDYAQRHYGILDGDSLVLPQKTVLLERDYTRNVKAFESKLLDEGLHFDGEKVVKEKPYTFNEVKALDVHHLLYDWTYGFEISKPNVDAFKSMTQKRVGSYLKAREYLVGTGQKDQLKILPEEDIRLMLQVAKDFSDGHYKPQTPKGGASFQRRTLTVNPDLNADLETEVRGSLEGPLGPNS